MATPVDENVDDLIDRLRRNYDLDLTDVRNKKQLKEKIKDMSDGEMDAKDALQRKKNLIKGYSDDMWSSEEVDKFVQFNKAIEKKITEMIKVEVPDVDKDTDTLTEKKLEKLRELVEDEDDTKKLRKALRKSTTDEEIEIITKKLNEIGVVTSATFFRRLKLAKTTDEVDDIIGDVEDSELSESLKEQLKESADAKKDVIGGAPTDLE